MGITGAAAEHSRSYGSWLRSNRDVLGVYGLLALLLLVYWLLSPTSFTAKHLLDVARIAAPLGILAIGQTLVLLTAGLDLSVGPIVTLTSIVASALMNNQNDRIGYGVVVTLVTALIIGLLNGLAVTGLRIPPFLTTLAMGTVIEGVYLIYSKGSPKGRIAPAFTAISDHWLGGAFPLAVLIWLAVWLIVAFVLYRTAFGRMVYAVGGGPKTARLSGIPVVYVTIAVYVLSALLAAVGGLMAAANIGVPSTELGGDYTLNSIAAAVIGGAAFTGGVGRLSGTFAGVLIITLLQSLLIVLNVQSAGVFIVQGVVIAVMVALNQRAALSS